MARRHRIFALYRELLANTPGIGFQPVAPWAEVSPWLFSVTVDEKEFGLGRDQLAQKLSEAKIDTRPFFMSLHRLPPFREGAKRRGEHLPVPYSAPRTCAFMVRVPIAGVYPMMVIGLFFRRHLSSSRLKKFPVRIDL
jgi:dTDP-4-amino-4,6-dideoxygalactose transaminase